MNKERLHPLLRYKFELMKESFTGENEMIMVSGYRSKAQQKELYELPGVYAAPPGRSLHNYGYAFDIAFIRPDNTADYSWWQFDEVSKLAKQEGLVWGGDWKVQDGPHFQFPTTWRKAAAGWKPHIGGIRDHLIMIKSGLSDILETLRGH